MEKPPKIEEMFKLPDGRKESKESVFKLIRGITQSKIENPSEVWFQSAELNKIADHWHNFDDETRALILTAIPESASYILDRKLQLTDTPVAGGV